MTMTDLFLQALETYEEVQTELQTRDRPALPHQSQTPILIGQLPYDSLLLGLADDGLPVAFDLSNPSSGPLLVAGDGGCGKTALLEQLARNSLLQDPGEIQFGTLTPFPEEWRQSENLPNCLGIWPVYHASAQHFLAQLVSWAEVLPETHQRVLLFIDGLDLLLEGGLGLRHHLRWLLQHGPESQILPVVSLNPSRLPPLQAWQDYFPSRLFGQVRQAQTARLLAPDPEIDLGRLTPGVQFGLLQAGRWLRFRIPSC